MYGISKPYRDPSFSIDFYSVTMHWINEESKEISPAIKPSKVLISDAVKRLSLISSGEPSAVAIFDDLNMAAYASTRSQLLIMFLYDSQNVSVPFYIENVLHNPSSGSHKTSILMGASSIYVEQHSYPELKTWIEYYHSNLEVTSFKIYYNVRSDSAHCKNPLAICSGLSYLVESLTRDFEKFADLRIELLEWTFMVMLFEDAHHSQTVALNSALYRFKGVVQWLFNFDLDEYVIDSPDNISSLRHFLSTHNDVPGLILGSRWAVMENLVKATLLLFIIHSPWILSLPTGSGHVILPTVTSTVSVQSILLKQILFPFLVSTSQAWTSKSTQITLSTRETISVTTPVMPIVLLCSSFITSSIKSVIKSDPIGYLIRKTHGQSY